MSELPPDPFDPDIPPEVFDSIKRIEDPETREGLNNLLREIPRATEELKALLDQKSFDDFSRAVSTLDEERLRVVVFVAGLFLVQHRLGPDQLLPWMRGER